VFVVETTAGGKASVAHGIVFSVTSISIFRVETPALGHAMFVSGNYNRLVEYLPTEKLDRDFLTPSRTVPNVTHKGRPTGI
jgi:hypothetical protein